MRDPRGQSRECVEAEWGETEESFTWRSASSKANEASRSCGEPECGVTEKTGLHLDNSFEEAKVAARSLQTDVERLNGTLLTRILALPEGLP